MYLDNCIFYIVKKYLRKMLAALLFLCYYKLVRENRTISHSAVICNSECFSGISPWIQLLQIDRAELESMHVRQAAFLPCTKRA